MADVETSQSPVPVPTKASETESPDTPKVMDEDEDEAMPEVETPLAAKQNGIDSVSQNGKSPEKMDVDDDSQAKETEEDEDEGEETTEEESNKEDENAGANATVEKTSKNGDGHKPEAIEEGTEDDDEDDDDDDDDEESESVEGGVGGDSEEKDKPAQSTEAKASTPGTPASTTTTTTAKPDAPTAAGESNGKSAAANGDVIGIDSDSEEDEGMMEVDGGQKTTNGGVEDEDKPVSIGSDSDSESDITSQSNSNAPTQDNSDVQEILSDKEDDCVVIDDKDDKCRKGGDVDPLGLDKASSTSCSPVSFKIAMPEAKITREPPSLTVVDTAKLIKTNLPNVTIQKTPSIPTINKNLLPALTDDMFVLEAPSFIVPYIYEKPPGTPLKEVVTKMGREVKEAQDKERESDEKKMLEEKDEKDKKRKLLEEEAEKLRKKQKKKPKRGEDDDWDEAETSDEEDSDEEGEGVTKVLIKDIEDDLLMVKEHIITPETVREAIIGGAGKRSDSFFDSPLGKFFMGIGVNLVQEYVQTDLLRQQKRKRDKEGGQPSASTQMAINSLMKNLETSKENNAPFKYELKRCEYCNFKSESSLAMAHHYETPHSRVGLHKCNFCQYESKNAHEILYHMEALHNIKGRLEKAPSYHQCPNCMFEDNGRSKLARHAIACAKKFKPEANLTPPLDWDPPAKIPKIKPKHGLVGTATAYQLAAQQQQAQLMAQQQKAAAAAAAQQKAAAMTAALRRSGGGRPTGGITPKLPGGTVLRANVGGGSTVGIAGRNFNLSMSGGNYMQASSNNRKSTTPSISITPVPRQSASNSNAFNPLSAAATTKIPPGVSPGMKPGQNPNATGKTSFVICEICDGYIKDLDQLRNHMQWIHKVKIHPKMIYNRPPLNCQKCQYRFFTDQGLERHLLGSHGLVTSSMQDAANKSKDAGRCPVCGRVYQWKLLNHVSRDHNMTLKPAHLSYKCTVCTATFGMYKQFESHVYSAHSTVAKKTGGDARKSTSGGPSGSSGGGSSSSSSQSLLKPLKINDEITIIPQPSKPVISNTKPIEIE